MQALADRGRDDEAIRTADEAVAMAEEAGLRDIADEMRVVVAQIKERTVDPDESRLILERIIADPDVRGTPAEIRALHHLGSLHHRAGRLAEAVTTYRLGVARARATGREWSPYGLECRLLAGIAAYELGDWDQADQVLDLEGEDIPQPAAAQLVAAALYVAAGRGEAAALSRIPELRAWWEVEGLVAVLSASAGIDLYGSSGDLAAAISLHDDAVELLTRLWRPGFQAQLRFGALLLGQLGHPRRRRTRGRAPGPREARRGGGPHRRRGVGGVPGPRSRWPRVPGLGGAHSCRAAAAAVAGRCRRLRPSRHARGLG